MAHNSVVPIVIALSTAGGVTAFLLLKNLFRRHTVWEYQKGLLYKNGVFQKELGAGTYWLWTPSDNINTVDIRKNITTLAGQEVVTADNVGVKLSVLISYQIVDAAKVINQSQSWYQELYAFTQLAARDTLSAMKVEEILQGRSALGEKLLELVKPQAAAIGIEMLMVQVKDVVLPADIRKIFADVLRAQKEGQAALERARGEQAALRSLANAARVLEGNPALMSLRVLQSLTGSGGLTPPTVVLNVAGGLLPLGPPHPPPPPPPPQGPHPHGHEPRE